jgi:hypothetical protein
MPFYYRAVTLAATMTTPSLSPAADTEVSGAPLIDINGSYSLSYSIAGSTPAKFRIEEQKDGGPLTVLADVPAGQLSFAISGRGNGLYHYRVAGLYTVQYGLLKGPNSATQTVQVDRRIEADVTSMLQTAISNVSFAAAVFEFDQTRRTQRPALRFFRHCGSA